MAELAIRPLCSDEWPAYRELRLRALAGAPDAFGTLLANAAGRPDSYWRELFAGIEDDPDGDTFVAIAVDGALVAACSVRRAADDPSAVRIFAMWVDEDHRGTALGRRLLSEAERWARERGLRRALLYVGSGNGPAEGLYETHGYRPTGKRQALREGSSIVAIELVKSLPTD